MICTYAKHIKSFRFYMYIKPFSLLFKEMQFEDEFCIKSTRLSSDCTLTDNATIIFATFLSSHRLKFLFTLLISTGESCAVQELETYFYAEGQLGRKQQNTDVGQRKSNQACHV